MATFVEYPCENCGETVRRQIGDEGRGRFCSVRCGRAAQPMKSREERFWLKVDRRSPDECWPWRGQKSTVMGHGLLKSGPRGQVRQEGAHRVSWELHNGPIPEGKNICHTCDNPPCVNPSHLYPGTDTENMRDRDTRGRHGGAKLTPRDVRAIRARRALGERCLTIATDYGISEGQVSMAARRLSYKHVD
jgi:hypothetical protein